MPYISEQYRNQLDLCIGEIVLCLKNTLMDKPYQKNELSNEDLLKISGNINYVFSRVCGSLMGDPSYSKIVILTGVLENVKQEFYRRVASSYEDAKIVQNGDIKEYKNVS